MLGIWLFSSTTAYAQNYEKIAPKIPQSTSGSLEKLEEAEPPEPTNSQVILPELKGLLFYSKSTMLENQDAPPLQSVTIWDVGLLNDLEFMRRMNTYLGEPLTLDGINQIAWEVVRFFREKDRPVVDSVIPEQAIENGILRILVIEGKLGRVKVEGNKWFSAKLIGGMVKFNEGDAISYEKANRELDWVNRNPFREVSLVYSKGDEYGKTDVILRVRDRFPVRFYTTLDDSGYDQTGLERISTGFNWGNAFFLDHLMNYQFTTSGHFNMFHAHSGSYVVPLPWKHTMTIFGSYAESDDAEETTFPQPGQPQFNQEGSSWQASFRYEAPLPSVFDINHALTFGYDFKQSDNDLEFGDTRVLGQTTDVSQFNLNYALGYADPWGSTQFSVTGFWSPGDMTGHNHPEQYESVRAQAGPDYLYAKFGLDRVTRLPGDFTWILEADAQISNENLISSEQFGIGGYTTVRGYDEREAGGGDEGWLIRNEIRTPSISLGQIFQTEAWNDQWQFLVFWDYGVMHKVDLLTTQDPFTEEDNNIILSGAGVGFRLTISPYVTARFDYAWQLTDTNIDKGASERLRDRGLNSRAHMGITISY